VALISNLVAFFGIFWTESACNRYFRVILVFQCLALWASHVLFVDRTITICAGKSGKKDRTLLLSLAALATLAAALELFAQLFSFRHSFVTETDGCELVFDKATNIAWLYYTVSVFSSPSFCHTHHALRPQLFSTQRLFGSPIIGCQQTLPLRTVCGLLPTQKAHTKLWGTFSGCPRFHTMLPSSFLTSSILGSTLHIETLPEAKCSGPLAQ